VGDTTIVCLGPSEGKKKDGENSRLDFRQKRKITNDEVRNIELRKMGKIDKSGLIYRGMTIETQLQVVEMAQIEFCKMLETMKTSIANANHYIKQLLSERKQAIDLAKAICPAYDATNEFWITVKSLSDDLLVAKQELQRLDNERNMELKKDMKSCDLYKSVLNSLFNNKKDLPPNIIQTSAKSDITTP